jgi:hypothetical protein
MVNHERLAHLARFTDDACPPIFDPGAPMGSAASWSDVAAARIA